MDLAERREDSHCSQKKNSNLLRYCCRNTRWIRVVLGSILFLSMYLPQTWGGEANLEEYYKTLTEIDKNFKEVKQKYHISGIVAGMDAQVEVKPRQGPIVGSGTRISRGSTARYYDLESKFESVLMEWAAKHEVKLANTFSKHWEPTRAKTNKLDFWTQIAQQLRKIVDYIAVPIKRETRSTCRAQNLTDHWPVMTYVMLPQKREGWRYENNSVLKRWKPQTEGDDAGFGRMLIKRPGRC